MKVTQMIEKVKETFTEPFDLITREFKIAGKIDAVAVYIDTICGGQRVSLEVIEPLSRLQPQPLPKTDIKTLITQVTTGICRIEEKQTYDEAVLDLLNGKTVLVVDAVKTFLVLDTTVFPARGVMEPPTNSVVLGPREGFIENTVVNIGLVRKRVKHPDLTLVNNVNGKYTNTNITIMYVKSIAEQRIVDAVIEKIKSIQIDGILDSFYVMQYLQEEKFNIFRQVGSSEKPDVIASKLLEGRVVIFVDGSPVVLSVPYMLVEDLHAADDYYTNSSIVTLRRFIRLFGGDRKSVV